MLTSFWVRVLPLFFCFHLSTSNNSVDVIPSTCGLLMFGLFLVVLIGFDCDLSYFLCEVDGKASFGIDQYM